MPFQALKIVEIDDAASGPSGQGKLQRIVLKLSQPAPREWADYFNALWEGHIYMMKRRAEVAYNSLSIVCMPEELEKDHLPELRKVIEQTNAAFAGHVASQEQGRRADEESAALEKKKITDLKKSIKFD